VIGPPFHAGLSFPLQVPDFCLQSREQYLAVDFAERLTVNSWLHTLQFKEIFPPFQFGLSEPVPRLLLRIRQASEQYFAFCARDGLTKKDVPHSLQFNSTGIYDSYIMVELVNSVFRTR
jgi:hypothetical protein